MGGPKRDEPSVVTPDEFKSSSGSSGKGLADKILEAKEKERKRVRADQAKKESRRQRESKGGKRRRCVLVSKRWSCKGRRKVDSNAADPLLSVKAVMRTAAPTAKVPSARLRPICVGIRGFKNDLLVDLTTLQLIPTLRARDHAVRRDGGDGIRLDQHHRLMPRVRRQ